MPQHKYYIIDNSSNTPGFLEDISGIWRIVSVVPTHNTVHYLLRDDGLRPPQQSDFDKIKAINDSTIKQYKEIVNPKKEWE